MTHVPSVLKRVGRVWRIVEGSLVLEGDLMPILGEKVYDSSMKEVGRVISVFGPVDRYFIEVDPTGKLEYRKGTPLYVLREKRRRWRY